MCSKYWTPTGWKAATKQVGKLDNYCHLSSGMCLCTSPPMAMEVLFSNVLFYLSVIINVSFGQPWTAFSPPDSSCGVLPFRLHETCRNYVQHKVNHARVFETQPTSQLLGSIVAVWRQGPDSQAPHVLALPYKLMQWCESFILIFKISINYKAL